MIFTFLIFVIFMINFYMNSNVCALILIHYIFHIISLIFNNFHLFHIEMSNRAEKRELIKKERENRKLQLEHDKLVGTMFI